MGPDLGSAGGQTVFERLDPSAFTVPIQLSDSHHGAPWIEESMWNLLHALESVVLILLASIARGAIVCMQWLLNLTLYADNRIEIDAAVRQVAVQVFWPLFGSTLAIAGFAAYARMKRSGGGSLFSDGAWIIAASIFAASFALAPSASLTTLDDARTSITTAALTGYSSVSSAGQSAAGFPAVQLPNDLPGATRKLSDAMFNTYVVTPWCYVAFNSADICKDVGKDYLTQDQRWQDLSERLAGKNGGNSNDATGQYCPNELNAQCDWIRGQSFGRAGAVIFVAVVTLPLVAMLIALVVFGLMAVIGFLLLILLGLFFLLTWMIPGRPREIGVRWLEELLGALFQAVIITAVIGAVMVLSSILNLGVGRYGFFVVGMFNLAVFITGVRMRGRLENVVGLGAGAGASPFSSYMAMRGLGAMGRQALKLTKGSARAGVSAAPVLVGAGLGMGRAAGQAAAGLGRLYGQGLRALAPLDNRPPPTPTTVATPYRRPGGPAGPGRRVVEPVRARAPRQLPPTAGDAATGRGRQLPPAGPAPVEVVPTGSGDGEGRRFVAGEPATRRSFAAETRTVDGAAVVEEQRPGFVASPPRQGRPARRVVEHSAPSSSPTGARATNEAITAGRAGGRGPGPVTTRELKPLANTPPPAAGKRAAGPSSRQGTPPAAAGAATTPPARRRGDAATVAGPSLRVESPRRLPPLAHTPPPHRGTGDTTGQGSTAAASGPNSAARLSKPQDSGPARPPRAGFAAPPQRTRPQAGSPRSPDQDGQQRGSRG
ncbi:hypothetical protein [Nakamurella endophytica]|uniref:hypothetical protein n=1 Tax=Nakamurella endophytica TaxID=1748367 RepID=UPI00166885EA|nr:hypothetical protein [Nakamurella endophytica]